MKQKQSIFASILVALGSLLLKFRYLQKINGFKEIISKGNSGILFLPNHPALIDPVLMMTLLFPYCKLRALADEYQVNKPLIKWFAKFFRVITLPNLSRGGVGGVDEMKQSLSLVVEALKSGDNVLLYPSGHLKRERYENLGARAAVNYILREIPELRVVLIRQNGLWGSSFSFGLNGKMPNFVVSLLRGLRVVFYNFLFFAPKRIVNYEFFEPADLPRNSDKAILNKFIENIYNSNEAPNTYVPYTIWEKGGIRQVPEPVIKSIKSDPSLIPEGTKKIILEHIATLTGRSNLKETDSLSYDLGMDSLSSSELVVWIEKEFGFSVGTPDSLKTVGDVMLAAAGRGISAMDADLKPPSQKWFKNKDNNDLLIFPRGTTIPEVILEQVKNNPLKVIVADQASGEKTYRDIIIGISILKPIIEQMEGEYIGIMLPASVGATLFYLAVLFAGKIPVMVNWTTGKRNLNHSLGLLGVKTVITANKLIQKLESQGISLEILAKSFIFVEDISKGISKVQKIKALFSVLLGIFPFDKSCMKETAVILFTSGSESLPKAVPLSHKNLLANSRDITNIVDLKISDILVGMLPPFHSFGLTVTMVFPLCLCVPVVYHVNPVESGILAKIIQTYGVTMLVGTPTFLSGIIRVAEKPQLISLKLAFTGAEKCPHELYESLSKICPGLNVLEGYGITECSPVVTLNNPSSSVPYSIGRALPSVEFVIRNIDTGLRENEGGTGMLFVRGDSIFSGYINFNGDSPFEEFEGKKWYKTGDIIELDKNGVMFFKGRLKRFIKIGGEMISLPAIEDVLRPHFTKETDEGPQIAIESTTNTEAPEIVFFTTKETDRNFVNNILRNAGLSPINNVRRVVKIESIPILGTGKTDYRSLKEILK